MTLDEKAQRATGGLVDKMTLAKSAAQAARLGVAKSSDEFARLVKSVEDFMAEEIERYARAHRPHLLVRKSKRLRKKALRDLPRRLNLDDHREALFEAALREGTVRATFPPGEGDGRQEIHTTT